MLDVLLVIVAVVNLGVNVLLVAMVRSVMWGGGPAASAPAAPAPAEREGDGPGIVMAPEDDLFERRRRRLPAA